MEGQFGPALAETALERPGYRGRSRSGCLGAIYARRGRLTPLAALVLYCLGSGLIPTKISAGTIFGPPYIISTPDLLYAPGLVSEPLVGDSGFSAVKSAPTNSSSGPVIITPIRGVEEEIIWPMLSTVGMWISSKAERIWVASILPSRSIPYDQTLIWRLGNGVTAAFNAAMASAVNWRGWIWFSNFRFASFNSSTVLPLRLDSTVSICQSAAAQINSTASPLNTTHSPHFLPARGNHLFRNTLPRKLQMCRIVALH